MIINVCLYCFVLTSFVIPVELFSGDSCVGENGAGTCKELSRCTHLLNEIRRAGTPMPFSLRRKLQHLACGFELDQPLICCESLHTNVGNGDAYEYHVPNRQDFRPSNNNWFGSNEDDGKIPNSVYNQYSTNKPQVDIRNHRNFHLLPTANCGPIESDRIYGGDRTRLFEMPWMVLLSYETARGTKLSCGGTLITERYVLTAAHCVAYIGAKLKLQGVIIGEYDIRTDPDCERIEGELVCAPNSKTVSIEEVIPHAGYRSQRLLDDIALIRLAEPADFSLDNMKPICLPITSNLMEESLDGLQGVVAGWGATEDGLQSPVLLSVTLPILSNENCRSIYNGSSEIYDTQFCAGGIAGKDSCGGDSGGPLLYPGRPGGAGARYVQRGIVSYGSKRCGLGGFPGVYTRVAQYMDWILDHLS